METSEYVYAKNFKKDRETSRIFLRNRERNIFTKFHLLSNYYL